MKREIKLNHFFNLLIKNLFFINKNGRETENNIVTTKAEPEIDAEVETHEREYVDFYRQTTRWQTL